MDVRRTADRATTGGASRAVPCRVCGRGRDQLSHPPTARDGRVVGHRCKPHRHRRGRRREIWSELVLDVARATERLSNGRGRASTRTGSVTMRLALFFIAAATLMLELLLTRVFDVILTPNMAYMVIACALFSFGLAGVCVTLQPGRFSRVNGAWLSMLAVLFAVSTLALRP